MPIYEYRCASCGHEVELMQKLDDPAPNPCPKCGVAQAMEKLVSRSAFHLKGGGWYSDLYGSSKKDSGGSSGGSSASSSTSSPASTATTTTSAPSAGSSSSSGTSAPASAPTSTSSGSSGKSS